VKHIFLHICLILLYVIQRPFLFIHDFSPRLDWMQTEIWSLPIQLVAAFTALFAQVAGETQGFASNKWRCKNQDILEVSLNFCYVYLNDFENGCPEYEIQQEFLA